MQTVTLVVGLKDGRKFEQNKIELVGYKGAKVTIKQHIKSIYSDMNYDKFLVLDIHNRTILIPKESITYIEVIPEN